MEALRIEKLRLKRGAADILKGVSLSVSPGEIHAVIGPNGAGKSSLAYTVMGLDGYRPEAGRILLNGDDITDWPITRRARAGLTLAWQEPARFEGVTVKQYLEIGSNAFEERGSAERGIPRLTPDEALERVGLSPKKYMSRQVDRSLSGGERKRIELASILLMGPKVIILDEPDSGIDTAAIDNIFQIIRELKQLGVAALLITHSEKVLNTADSASLLCSGVVVKTGPPEEAAEYYSMRCLPCPDETFPREVSAGE